MKTTIVLTSEELKNTDYRKFIINIRLSNPCRNGHDNFAITANGWYKNNKLYEQDVAGCLHDEILKLRPELKIFVDLHLCDFNGAPMYTIENGFYWLHKNKETVISYLRITEMEYDILYEAENKLKYSELLHSLGIVKRWKLEAEYAIKILEKMANEKYVNTSTKSHFE